MIFNLITAAILASSSFLGATHKSDDFLTTEVISDKINSSSDTLSTLNLQQPLFLEQSFDLDHDGKSERITASSTLGKEIGDENTKIYINDSDKPALVLFGYFVGLETHKMNREGLNVLEVRTITGNLIDTTFYIYTKGVLHLVPVSTSKPPSFYGIVTRNRPELKDINNDGTPELFAYYNFLYDSTRKVEVYRYNGKAFNKIQEYEEANFDRY